MTPKYSGNAASQRDRWMVSYADVLTIVLIFFLVAAAKSLETTPPRAVVRMPQPAPRVPVDPPRTNLLNARERLREQGLESKLESRGLVVSLPQVILFSPGADEVSAEALPTLARIAEVLRAIPNDVRLVGYADTVPIHSRRFQSNWDLSMARSRRILKLLSTEYAVAESRLSISSYGPYRPAASNDTADGRASNRRVEIVILDEGQLASAPAE
jgi:flagellar motor protein MotB